MSPAPGPLTGLARTVTGVLVLAVLALSFVCSRTAFAAPERVGGRLRVLLIVDDPRDPLVKRLEAELGGLDISLIERPSADRLDTAARETSAVAAIRVLPARNGVEVWMADATSGRSLLRQVIVDESPGGPNYGVVALQTAELIRTSLLYDEGQPPPEPAAAAPPAATPSDERPARENERSASESGQAGAQASLGALFSPGGVGPGLQLWLSAHYPLGRRLSVAVDLSAPLERGNIDGPEGSARVGAYFLGALIGARWSELAGPWFAGVGLGGGVLRATAEGTTAPPLGAVSAHTYGGVVYARADGGLRLASWLRVGARTVVGFTVPTIDVHFAGNRAGSWGSPLVGVFGLLEVPWG